jgi:positive regulator of sigma E activity
MNEKELLELEAEALLKRMEKRLLELEKEAEQLAQSNGWINIHLEWPLLILMVGAWIAGASMAGDGWHFVAAVCLPVYAWLIVVVKFLTVLGVI